MPIYDFRCENCQRVKENFAKIEERTMICDCGGKMNRLISRNYCVHSDLKPYIDEHIGVKPVYVKSKQHREQLMKKHGVYESYGKGWV
jgi:putative FmdB family regulatory protein